MKSRVLLQGSLLACDAPPAGGSLRTGRLYTLALVQRSPVRRSSSRPGRPWPQLIITPTAPNAGEPGLALQPGEWLCWARDAW